MHAVVKNLNKLNKDYILVREKMLCSEKRGKILETKSLASCGLFCRKVDSLAAAVVIFFKQLILRLYLVEYMYISSILKLAAADEFLQHEKKYFFSLELKVTAILIEHGRHTGRPRRLYENSRFA